MAVIMSQSMPAGVPISMIDAVTEEMGVDADPPAGLILHVHYEEGGQVHITDVWESAADHQKFVESRLGPAMAKVAAASGFELPPPGAGPVPSYTEVHRVVRGS